MGVGAQVATADHGPAALWFYRLSRKRFRPGPLERFLGAGLGLGASITRFASSVARQGQDLHRVRPAGWITPLTVRFRKTSCVSC